MPFRIKRHESVREAIARIVRDDLADARAEATRPGAPLDARVHAVRSHVKKARATLRLARPRARALDGRLRALGRTLSNARDAAVVRDALREVAREVPGRRPPLAASDEAKRRELGVALRDLSRLRRRIERWPIDGSGRSVRRAFARSFRRARRIRSKLRPRSDAAVFHRWRKVVERLALQSRLLRRIVPELERSFDDPVQRLSDLLGEIHDLAVLRAMLREARSSGQEDAADGAILDHLQAHDRAARAEALALGARALAPRTRLVKAWLRDGWRTWRRGPEEARRRARAAGRATAT